MKTIILISVCVFLLFCCVTAVLNFSRKEPKKLHFVTYTYIDTVKNETSIEAINIDAVSEFFLDSSWEHYNREGMKEIVDRLMKYGNKDTTIYFGN